MPIKIRVDHPDRCMGCYNCVFACSRELYGVISKRFSAIQVHDSKTSNTFLIRVCVGCTDPDCANACPYEALKPRPEGGVELVNPDKCKKCEDRPCIPACPVNALPWDPINKKPIICTECGECAKYCPHEVIFYGEVIEATPSPI